MSSCRILLAIVIPILIHGCGEPKHRPGAGPGRGKEVDSRKRPGIRDAAPDAYVAGVVVEIRSNPSEYRYVPLAGTGFPDPQGALGLAIGRAARPADATPLSPAESTIVEVGVEYSNYTALFTKSYQSPSRPALGRLYQFTDSADPRVANKVAFHVDAGTGTVLLEDACPIAETDWVAAGSEGTLFAFEVVNRYLCRVYLPDQASTPTIYFFEPSKAADPRSRERQIQGRSLTGRDVYLDIACQADGTLRFNGPYYFNGDPVLAGTPKGRPVADWVADLLKRWRAFRP